MNELRTIFSIQSSVIPVTKFYAERETTDCYYRVLGIFSF